MERFLADFLPLNGIMPPLRPFKPLGALFSASAPGKKASACTDSGRLGLSPTFDALLPATNCRKTPAVQADAYAPPQNGGEPRKGRHLTDYSLRGGLGRARGGRGTWPVHDIFAIVAICNLKNASERISLQ